MHYLHLLFFNWPPFLARFRFSLCVNARTCIHAHARALMCVCVCGGGGVGVVFFHFPDQSLTGK